MHEQVLFAWVQSHLWYFSGGPKNKQNTNASVSQKNNQLPFLHQSVYIHVAVYFMTRVQ